MAGGSDGRKQGDTGALIEVVLVTLVFAAVGAWPAPDVNEAVYLTKARHAADAAWGRCDFFLESPDAHVVFFTLCGPLAATLPLDAAAWIGRWIGWFALAAGFVLVARPLVPGTPARLAAAALFTLALRHTTAAGEWVIGGCEAKVFAWALVFGALGEAGRGRFAGAWCLAGAGTALHPIVGGWTLVALVTSRVAAPGVWHDAAPPTRAGRLTAAGLLAAGAIGVACGVVPALFLDAGSDAATRARAATIYVVERLPHHLRPRSFPEPMIARHLLAIGAWWLLHRALPPTAARKRLATLVAVALGLSAAGCAISAAEPLASAVTHGLLRFYWFRLADVLVPLGLATSAAALLADDAACARALGRPRAVRFAAAALLAADLAAQVAHWPIPGRHGLHARADQHVAAAAWEDVCVWVREHAPADARFLTPRGSTTFTWRTGRSEVVSWKNSPQDARSLVEWRRRITDCFSRDGSLAGMATATATLGPDRLRDVAARYGADHMIAPLDQPGLADVPGERLYANDRYAVYRLDRDRGAAAPR